MSGKSLSGADNPFFGNKHSLETKRKMSLAKSGGVEIWKYDQEIIALYQEGLSSWVIARNLGVSRSYVLATLKKNNIPRRSGGNKKGYIPWNKGKECSYISGKNNPRWKGGITEVRDKIRHMVLYKQWRRTIYQRDNWTCVICKIRGGNLEVDHYKERFCDIISKFKIRSLEDAKKCDTLWDINNGRTLCVECHNETKRISVYK